MTTDDGRTGFDHYHDRTVYRDEQIEEEGFADALSIEQTTIYTVVLGTGGPHDEVRIEVDRDGDVVDGMYEFVWGTTRKEHRLSRSQAQEWADAYGIPDLFR